MLFSELVADMQNFINENGDKRIADHSCEINLLDGAFYYKRIIPVKEQRRCPKCKQSTTLRFLKGMCYDCWEYYYGPR